MTSSRVRRIVLALAILTVAAAVALLLIRGDADRNDTAPAAPYSPAATPGPADPQPQPQAAPATAPESKPSASAASRPTPAIVRATQSLFGDLPPLAQRIDDLTRRADAGDAVASCQLGLELMQCRDVRPMRMIMAAWESRPRSGPEWAEHMQRERAKLLRLEQQCAGIADARIDEVPRRMFAAADAGNAIAAGVSVTAATQWVGARLASDPNLVARLRDGYPRWLDRAFASGQPLFIMDVMQSARYSSPTNLNFQALTRDPVAMRALDLLLLKVAADTGEAAGELPMLRLAQSEATLDTATMARADALAMRWFAAWKNMPRDDDPGDFDPDEINWMDYAATRPRVLHEACERG